MRYVWINPVTDRMYDRETLNGLLERHGFCRVVCREDWGAVVREKYRKLAEAASGAAASSEEDSEAAAFSAEVSGAVADVRCPAVERLLREMNLPGLTVPDIEPILLHCAREISGRADLQGLEKVITTPCAVLAEAGNRLGLPETEFVPWNCFLRRLGVKFPGKPLESSPIPPGFFGNSEKTDVVTGPETVERYLKEKGWRGAKMVEFLYCDGGCHGGDGVTGL